MINNGKSELVAHTTFDTHELDEYARALYYAIGRTDEAGMISNQAALLVDAFALRIRQLQNEGAIFTLREEWDGIMNLGCAGYKGEENDLTAVRKILEFEQFVVNLSESHREVEEDLKHMISFFVRAISDLSSKEVMELMSSAPVEYMVNVTISRVEGFLHALRHFQSTFKDMDKG